MSDVAIIMCTWKRIECLDRTLELLSKQKNKLFSFYIWNNNTQISETVDFKCKEFVNEFLIEVFHSETNVGGFGRYLYAKKLIDKYNKIIFIDDDQIFSELMVDRFLNEFELNVVKSRWAFRILSKDYAHRQQILESNRYVHYCGTGGMILPIDLFRCDTLYEIPHEYLFIEDLWLCYVATHYLKYKLKSICSDFIEQIIDGKDQSNLKLLEVKRKFFKYLINVNGWKILEN